MKIKCCQLPNQTVEEFPSYSNSVTIDRTYIVLSIFISLKGHTKYQIIADDQRTPIFVYASQFDIVNDDIPESWSLSIFKQTGQTNKS